METATDQFTHLGPQPYKFVGLETREDREDRESRRKAEGLAYTTNYCGGLCSLCGTAISNVFWMTASDGRRFKLGCDCTTKVRLDAETLKEIDQAHRAYVRARYQSRNEARRAACVAEFEARAARENAVRVAREERYWAANPNVRAQLAAVEHIPGYTRRFVDRLRQMISRGECPEPYLLWRLYKIYMDDVSPDVGYLGEVGERLEVTATLEIISDLGDSRLYALRTSEGAVIVCWTRGAYWELPVGGYSKPGHVVRLRGTVKSHKRHAGRCQTEVQRIRLY